MGKASPRGALRSFLAPRFEDADFLVSGLAAGKKWEKNLPLELTQPHLLIMKNRKLRRRCQRRNLLANDTFAFDKKILARHRAAHLRSAKKVQMQMENSLARMIAAVENSSKTRARNS